MRRGAHDTRVVGSAHCGEQVYCLPLYADRPACREEGVLQTLSLDTYGGWSAQVWTGFSLTDAHGQAQCGEQVEQTLSGAVYGGRLRTAVDKPAAFSGGQMPRQLWAAAWHRGSFWDVPSDGSS